MSPAGAMTAPAAARAVLLVGVAPQAKAVRRATGREAVPKALAMVATVIAHPVLVMREGATEVGAARTVDPTASAPPETVTVDPTASAPPGTAIVDLTATALLERADAAPSAGLDPARVTGVPTAAIGATAVRGSVALTAPIVDPARATAVRTAGTEPRVVKVSVARTPVAAGTVQAGMRAMDPEAVLVGTAGRTEVRSPAVTTAPAAGRVDRTTTVAAALA